MLFSSPTFLFYFLPVCLIVFLVIGKRLRNPFLLAASLAFYIWGETIYFPVILLSIGVNFLLGQWIQRSHENVAKARRIVTISLIFNIALLAFFKLYAAYGLQWLSHTLSATFQHPDLCTNLLNILFPPLLSKEIQRSDPLPVGISFYTFAAISYILDIYKERYQNEPRLSNFALYILLFPKVVAGPIVRYGEMAAQLVDRLINTGSLAEGARRFVLGFGKKVLIADALAPVVDRVFALQLSDLTTSLAWLGLVCFTIQIYFDFSGYTDMAIGLGQMLGFKFVENFNYPYISKSVTEFWRRWHISLSRWFRDYLFFPLERRRAGATGFAQSINILIVFLLTGLWHGVTPTFIVWGLLHGSAISLEVSGFGKMLKSAWAPLQHIYALTIIMTGWVFFRAGNLPYALGYLKALVGFSQGSGLLPFSDMPVVNTHTWLALIVGALFSAPILPKISGLSGKIPQAPAFVGVTEVLRDLLLLGVFLLSIIVMAGSTYHAYIYFRF